MPAENSDTGGRPLLGVALVALTVLIFAVTDTIGKGLTASYPVPLIVALRFFINLVVLALLLWPRHRARLWKTQRTGLVLLRGLMLALGSLAAVQALKYLPVAESISIFYLWPFILLVLSQPVLGERVGAVGWLGAAAGFAGVLLILRPGAGLAPLGVVFALMNVSFGAAYHMLTRLLARTETTIAMLFHAALVGTVVLAFPALRGLEGLPAPGGVDLLLLAMFGGLATFAHFVLTAAYREAPASLLAPVNYLHILWAGVLGWLIFGHVPDALSLVGMVVVATAGAGVALYTHVSGRRRQS